MNCGRSTTAATFVIEGLFGFLPYGQVTNRLHCRKGCGDRFGMILPLDAPSPRAYAERYSLKPLPKRDRTPRPETDIEADCLDRLIEVGEGGTFLKCHARAAHQEIVHFGFDLLLKKLANRHSGPPHLIVARGAQWSRDSKRDFKVVGGKFIELLPEDPDPEEEGIG